jgi:multiple sugar transport system permease protein
MATGAEQRLRRVGPVRRLSRFADSWSGPAQPFWGFLFVLPILVLFLAFKFWPIAYAFWLSFTNTSPVNHTSAFIGLQNYIDLVSDAQFLRALTVTLYYCAGTVLPVVVISLGIALMLNRRLPARALFRVLLFFPAIVPIIVVPILWQFLFHPYGLVNSALEAVGLPGVTWLLSSDAVVPALIVTTSWRLIPICVVIYLAGLQGIPELLYEAAEVDGASAWQRFRYVTIPQLRPTLLVVVIFAVTLTAKSLVFMLVMTSGGPDNASRTLSLFIYQMGFRFSRIGYASSAAIVLLFVIVIITAVNVRIFRSND